MSLPHAAALVDAAALADELIRYRVVDAERLAALMKHFGGATAQGLAEHLVRSNVLTEFQAERALAGEARMLILGPYHLTGTAGSGTFGPLFTAAHTSKPGVFAVRVLPLRSLWKARQAKQLARVLSAGVAHPAVVPLVEVDSANGFHYLVWPHAEGQRLAEVAVREPLPPGEVVALLGHLAEALAACHARGAVHGAITPHSVVISSNGLPRLLELGAGALLAQNVADDESLFDTMSSGLASANVLTFAAPEVASDPESPTEAADQYALGAVGYYALTGLPPYPHPTLGELVRAKRAGPPPPVAIVNPEVPAELGELLERMMLPAPGGRFATLAEVQYRLGELGAAGGAPAGEVFSAVSLAQLQEARRASGLNPQPGSEVRPAERDDSSDSVQFDLPELPDLPPLPETIPEATSISSHGTMPAHVASPAEEAPAPPRPAPVLSPGQPNAPDPGAPPDPRLSAPPPVPGHTGGIATPGARPADDPPCPSSSLWRSLKRRLLFWQAAHDVVQVSVFGPSAARPGQAISLTVYLHPPDAAASVALLSRAFQPDDDLVGTGYLTREVPRASELAVHLSVAGAGVATPLLDCPWRGQPHRLDFELHVPWESPDGPTPGLVSVGLGDLRIGKVEFRLNVLPRKA